ncbi:glycosyltransferase family 4 protein [Aquirufa sp. ROCK2-A2]
MSIPKRILFDAERMKYPNTGLFHFCKELASALHQEMDSQKEELEILTNQKSFTLFPSKLFRKLQFWHKVILPSSKNIDVWQASHQDTQYYPYRKKVPIVLTIQDINYYHDPKKSKAKKQAFLADLQKKVDAASYLIFISEYTQKDVEKHLNIQGKPQKVIYNGCNLPPQIPANSTIPSENIPYLFTIGTITDKKNFHVLPRLLVNSNYLLIIAGIVQSDKYLQKIKDEAEKLGVLSQVKFVGAVDDVQKAMYFEHCEALVFPSLAEGFGLPVIEAMHFGKPVFLSKYTSLPEIGGDVAYYFDSFEGESMRKTLSEGFQHYLENNPKLAIQQRSQLFSWKTAAKEYLEIYRTFY